MPKQEIEVLHGGLEQIMGDVIPEVEDSEQMQRLMVSRVFEADTLADLFGDDKTIATRDYLGVPISVSRVRLVKSSIEESRGVYMLIEATNIESCTPVVLNTGAPRIMAILWRLRELGKLPVEVAVREAAVAQPGRSAPLTLEPVGATLTSVEAGAGK